MSTDLKALHSFLNQIKSINAMITYAIHSLSQHKIIHVLTIIVLHMFYSFQHLLICSLMNVKIFIVMYYHLLVSNLN